jgi:fructose-bisphosphate aldolase class II
LSGKQGLMPLLHRSVPLTAAIRGKPELDFDRLKKIKKLTGIPLVLHGSSGVPDEDIRHAISLGVRKVNIDTDIREAFVQEIRQSAGRAA